MVGRWLDGNVKIIGDRFYVNMKANTAANMWTSDTCNPHDDVQTHNMASIAVVDFFIYSIDIKASQFG